MPVRLGAVRDGESQALVQSLCGLIMLRHMQLHAAIQHARFALRGFDQRMPDALSAHVGKQADIDQQMIGRYALQIITADRAALGMLERKKVGIAEMQHVMLVLQSELLVEKTPFRDLGPRQRRHFFSAGGGVKIVQPRQVFIDNATQRKPAPGEERGGLHAVGAFWWERSQPLWYCRRHVRGTRERYPAAQCKNSRPDTAVGFHAVGRRLGWG